MFFSKVLTSILPIANGIHYRLSLQLAAFQLIEQGKLQADTPVSTYLPVFENPIILDDVAAEKPSFKPATEVIRIQHLLNYSSGIYYPQIFVLPNGYTEPHDQENPVEHFYDLIKVSPVFIFDEVRFFVYTKFRVTYLLFPSNLSPVPTVSLRSHHIITPTQHNGLVTLLILTYSSLVVYGYNSETLGFIIEKITGQTLEEYL